MTPAVSITIVTFNSRTYIEGCLRFVFAQNFSPFEVIVVDNASSDGTPDLLRQYESRARVIYNRVNNGFAGGQNQAISLSEGEWILTLNPDVRLTPEFLLTAVAAGRSDERIGAVSGKLLAMSPDFSVPGVPVLDSAGIYFTRSLRHFDRGSREADRGQYDEPEFVFGVTGAAALYRRRMIADISDRLEFFDNDFFAYREDADVAWRAQLLGWRCLYWPKAVAYHVRNVLPSNRRSSSAAINMHSVKNRFLMRIKNLTPSVFRANANAIAARDALVIGGCLFREFRSLPAFWYLVKLWRPALRKRRDIMHRRRASESYIVSWFRNQPASFPLDGDIAQHAKALTLR